MKAPSTASPTGPPKVGTASERGTGPRMLAALVVVAVASEMNGIVMVYCWYVATVGWSGTEESTWCAGQPCVAIRSRGNGVSRPSPLCPEAGLYVVEMLESIQ